MDCQPPPRPTRSMQCRLDSALSLLQVNIRSQHPLTALLPAALIRCAAPSPTLLQALPSRWPPSSSGSAHMGVRFEVRYQPVEVE